MTNKNKFKVYLLVAIIFLIISVVIFILADGLRRWYSGLLFVFIGGFILYKAIYEHRNTN